MRVRTNGVGVHGPREEEGKGNVSEEENDRVLRDGRHLRGGSNGNEKTAGTNNFSLQIHRVLVQSTPTRPISPRQVSWGSNTLLSWEKTD